MDIPVSKEALDPLVAREQLLLEYIRSYSRYYSRSESKTRQRCREQLFQEREMGPLVERLERLCGSLAGMRVLEIGSGSGGRSVAVALRGAVVFGIEPSAAGVEISRLRAQRYSDLQVQFEVGVGEHLPFPDASFDLVFSTDVLQHLQDLKQVLAETHRVLKPGGQCYHEAPNNLYPYEFHYRLFWLPYTPKPLGKLYARLRGKDPRHLDDISFLYRRHLIAAMRRAGFTSLRDVYVDEMRRKAQQADLIESSLKRKVFRLFQWLRAVQLAIRIASAIGIHPQLRIHGVKPV
ncbi:MAG: class I SAM-dependent methyltransferase [Sphingomonadaceae bacterium]